MRSAGLSHRPCADFRTMFGGGSREWNELWAGDKRVRMHALHALKLMVLNTYMHARPLLFPLLP